MKTILTFFKFLKTLYKIANIYSKYVDNHITFRKMLIYYLVINHQKTKMSSL